MAAIARNQQCPCGSGKRYKECHGALAPASTPAADVPDGPIAIALHAALAAQQQGRYEDARRLYSDVLSLAPNHFDAVHMLGVVHYQLGLLEDARRYLERAAALRPSAAAVYQNQSLVAAALEYAVVEREICREVLPRLQPLCVPPGEFGAWLDSASAVHIVVFRPGSMAASKAFGSLRALCAQVPVHCWCEGEEATFPRDWKALDAAAGALPRGGVLVVFAGVRTLAHWIEAAAPDRVALMLTEDEPGQVIDRLRELTLQGRRHATILYAAADLARAIGLPGTVVREASVGAAA
jgi:tetratricopeptide (TPR) repeat protein